MITRNNDWLIDGTMIQQQSPGCCKTSLGSNTYTLPTKTEPKQSPFADIAFCVAMLPWKCFSANPDALFCARFILQGPGWSLREAGCVCIDPDYCWVHVEMDSNLNMQDGVSANKHDRLESINKHGHIVTSTAKRGVQVKLLGPLVAHWMEICLTNSAFKIQKVFIVKSNEHHE